MSMSDVLAFLYPAPKLSTLYCEAAASSDLVHFVVGPDKQVFSMHSTIPCELSSVLKAMLKGPFREASRMTIEWPDIDVDVFLSFWTFAYSGRYATPKPETPSKPTTQNGNRFAKRNPLTENADAFKDEHAVMNELKQQALLLQDYREQQVEIYLHHAKVAVFADRYHIADLEYLAMLNLQLALSLWVYSSSAIEAVIALIRYCFETPAHDKLRFFVGRFAALHHTSELNYFEDYRDLQHLFPEFKAYLGMYCAEPWSMGLKLVDCENGDVAGDSYDEYDDETGEDPHEGPTEFQWWW